MRVRAGLAIGLALLLNTGCRNALTPDIDRNRPPETWITAAPQDSITLHRRDGVDQPQIGFIPVKFHMYWAGADQDGAVVGFYWAVVETIPRVPPGATGIPPLPGPRASDYHYTSRTDSVFSFTVSEFAPDRQHAFYIYAVDNKGKADPTPARFIFNALDRFPPVPIIDYAAGTGKIARVLSKGRVTLKDTTIFITDTLKTYPPAPKDSLMSNSQIEFRWHGEPTAAGTYVAGYKYKLDEPVPITVDSSVHAVTYNGGVGTTTTNPGLKIFTLQAIDGAGGSRETNRKFQLNRSPDTWFAGPDPNLIPIVPNSGGQRYIDVARFPSPGSPGSFSYPGSLLSCDSLTLWPSERKPSQTFWEIYQDRLYVHAENDTVHMNSWVITHEGGRDDDSPYAVQVQSNDAIKDTTVCLLPGEVPIVIRPAGPSGQPIQFKLVYAHRLDPNYGTVQTPTSALYFPVFDANSSQRRPVINGYSVFSQSGRVYLIARAHDADGADDLSLQDPVSASVLADLVDSGLDQNPAHVGLRKTKILTFYVNKSPYLLVGDPTFYPKPPLAPPGDTIATSPSRLLDLNLLAKDDDPYEPGSGQQPGGPSQHDILRWQVTVFGKAANGRDTSYAAPRTFSPRQTIDLAVDAPYIVSNDLTLSVQLCDCSACEDAPGSGRCIYQNIPLRITGAAASATGTRMGSLLNRDRSDRPGKGYAP